MSRPSRLRSTRPSRPTSIPEHGRVSRQLEDLVARHNADLDRQPRSPVRRQQPHDASLRPHQHPGVLHGHHPEGQRRCRRTDRVAAAGVHPGQPGGGPPAGHPGAEGPASSDGRPPSTRPSTTSPRSCRSTLRTPGSPACGGRSSRFSRSTRRARSSSWSRSRHWPARRPSGVRSAFAAPDTGTTSRTRSPITSMISVRRAGRRRAHGEHHG